MLNVLSIILICFPVAMLVSIYMASKNEPMRVTLFFAVFFLVLGALPPAIGVGLLMGWF